VNRIESKTRHRHVFALAARLRRELACCQEGLAAGDGQLS
jgi:hypothetical protein